MKNTLSLMFGSVAGVAAVGWDTLAHVTTPPEFLLAYSMAIPTSLTAAASLFAMWTLRNSREPEKFAPLTVFGSFLIAAGCATGMAYEADLPLLPKPQNVTTLPMHGTCAGAQVSFGQLVLPEGCTLGL